MCFRRIPPKEAYSGFPSPDGLKTEKECTPQAALRAAHLTLNSIVKTIWTSRDAMDVALTHAAIGVQKMQPLLA